MNNPFQQMKKSCWVSQPTTNLHQLSLKRWENMFNVSMVISSGTACGLMLIWTLNQQNSCNIFTSFHCNKNRSSSQHRKKSKTHHHRMQYSIINDMVRQELDILCEKEGLSRSNLKFPSLFSWLQQSFTSQRG